MCSQANTHILAANLPRFPALRLSFYRQEAKDLDLFSFLIQQAGGPGFFSCLARNLLTVNFITPFDIFSEAAQPPGQVNFGNAANALFRII